MISFKMKDYNICKIAEGADFLNQYETQNYEIVGLKLEGRPHIRIVIPADGHVKTNKVTQLFNNNKINPKGYVCEIVKNDDLKNKIVICLRKDVREDVRVAKKLIQTIIFLMEGRLYIPKGFKLNLGSKIKPYKKKKLVVKKLLSLELQLPDNIPVRPEVSLTLADALRVNEFVCDDRDGSRRIR